ncbi:cupredoxin-like protein [Nocardiopsis sp. Huas11]|uniref:cupredoxin domain-containing protein n=1 Tax=Nocardiopsis sp. Huas11 TaxID=2183912 RepID=UPI000EB06B76|nr:cupredoxin domain-containing protein [Nocardiopsis sp. Huas11]RKS08916.1 cupredoxin-like protein [Nocardiopsis sp. Huas11]
MSRRTVIALVAAGVLGLTACADDGEDPVLPTEEAAPETITVTAEETQFTGIPENMFSGTVDVVFENLDTDEHDLVVEELGDEQVIPATPGGESATGSVTLEPGTYTFYCSLGDHREMGMEVTVTVEDEE